MLLFIEAGVEGIEIFAVEHILDKPQAFAEALVMDDLTLTEKFYRVTDVGVIGKAEDIVIGEASFLLGGEILVDIGDSVACALEGLGGEGHARGCDRVDACGMVGEIGIKAAFLDLFHREISGQLVDYRADHFHMGEFLGADIVEYCLDFTAGGGITLVEIAQGCA